jgi:hypothetical protein
MAKAVLIAAIALALLSGCDAIFTYSALSGLQRDPADMPLDQRVKYAEDALASGDEGAIADAYDAIKDDAASSSDGDLQLLAGELALELSGINDAFDDLINMDLGGTMAENETYINQLVASLDASFVSDSAGLYQQADINGGDLSGTDYMLGALAILAAAVADPAQGNGDVGTLASTDPGVVAAIAFLAAAQAALPPDDPSFALLQDFDDFLSNQIP